MMKLIHLTSIIILVTIYSSNGQVTPIPDAIIPPSPTAFNLGKYGLMKTGLFTGTVNAEIPLLEYKTPNLNVPISLTYSSNGIRVEEAESRTGLVWNLNAGGVIIRNIKGNPDIYPASKENAPYPDEVVDQLVSERTSGLAPVLLQMYLLRGNTPGFDTEYDVFSFNFLNIKGKFILTSRGEVVQESKSALRIEVINSIDNGFMITDDHGIQYKFTETETTQVSSGPDARNPPAVTAWYLTQIIHPKGDVVSFSYNRIVTTILYNGEQSYTRLPSTVEGADNAAWNGFFVANSGYKQSLPQLNTIEGKRIAHIASNYAGSIMFSVNLPNSGQPGDSLLTNIRQINEQGQLVENIGLDYIQTSNDRVFLSSVVFLDPLKKYVLNYYSPELFPGRTSFSQDYWGYFNGASNQTLLSRDKDFDARYPGLTFYGNREPAHNYAVYGMLRKITYPTGGYSMMQYEPNSYYTSRVERNYSNISLVSESGISPSGEVMSDIITAGANQTVDVFVTLANSSTCPETTDPDVIRRKGGQMRMFDITTGQNIFFTGTSDAEVTITNGLGDRIYQAALQAGHQYRLYFSTFACSNLIGTFRYEAGSSTIYYNAVTGGMRLRSAEHYSLTGENNAIYYRYVDSLESERSSGIVTINSPSFYSILPKTFFSPTTPCEPAAIPEGQRSTYRYLEDKLSTNSLDFMFNQAGNNIVYKTVIESNGIDNEDGCTLHRFRTSIDGGGQIISEYSNSYMANKAVTNLSWDNGLEDYTAYYSKKGQNLTLLKEEFLEYESVQVRSIPMIRIQHRYSTPCGVVHPPTPVHDDPYPATNTCSCEARRFTVTQQNSSGNYQFGICTANHLHSWYRDPAGVVKCNGKGNQNSFDFISNPFYQQPLNGADLNGIFPLDAVYYHFYSFLHHLSAKREIVYENGNTLETTIGYTYNDVNQLVSTTYQNSKAHIIRTTNLYPKDFANTTIYDLMVDKNMTGHVIKTTVFDLNANEEISNTNTEFMLWNNQFVVPKEVRKSYGGSVLTTEITFSNYDSKNNISETRRINGLTEVYLWGYNYQYPVAKITGSDYATVIATVTQAQVDAATSIANNDVNVRALLNNLRTIPGAMVTTYTYTPLIGLTSETDLAGRTTYYEYDTFGRLKTVRDDNRNVLKAYDYQYQEQL